MRLQPHELYRLFVEERDAELCRRIVEPLIDLDKETLRAFAATVELARARGMHLTISQAMSADMVLDSLFKLIHAVRNL